ncbi:MAG: hypothetical protein A2498_10135 [Lentisphaerae bacterium RIFOXYC12_FULL_60_16]|nr:MAG: hypothetical protein A2498_10135 [Lentisphaerae bacterium RIFOXYC12_FULL_60_16]OGV84790.1 MAG: hypothetical protein A2340_04535 [Lentisphaerae bacterium RIFOXYB12_FULL_60_10]
MDAPGADGWEGDGDMKNLTRGLMPFWLMNDASTVAEKIRYMRACRKGGIRSLVLHCRAGNLIPYASAEWFAMIRDLVNEGRRLGMTTWLYDEDPYPSGAAGGMVMEQRPDLAARYIQRQTPPATLKPGQLWFIGRHRVVWAGLVPVTRPGPTQDLTGMVGSVRADWFMKRWDSRYYYPTAPFVDCPRGDAINQQYTLRMPLVPQGMELVALTLEPAGSEGSWGALPDLLHPDTFPVFRQLSLDLYEGYVGRHYGRTIPGIFTDEAKPHGGTPWTGEMPAGFKHRYGYDLLPRLYQLFGEALSDDYLKTRMDYRRWITGRFVDVFLRPYRRYCEDRKLLLVGHMSPEDDPCQEAVTIGSVMPIMKYLSCPGTDLIVPLTGDARAPALNFGSLKAGSVRAQLGAPAATSESLGCSDWNITTWKARQIYAWQMVLGIDRFFTHGFWNSNEGVANYEAPPEFGPYNSIFRGTGETSRWMGTVQQFTDAAVDQTRVGLLNNLLPFWTIPAGGWQAGAETTDRQRHALEQTLLACLQAQAAVQMVDEQDLVHGGVGARGITVGRCRYATLLVPAATHVAQAVVEKLKQAVARGTSVYWLGGGPKQMVTHDYRLVKCPALPGTVLRVQQPSPEWCRRHLETHVTLTGVQRGECYVRRFIGRDGRAYVLACNVGDVAHTVVISGEKQRVWSPVEVDGSVTVRGTGTAWSVPAGGAGLFRLDAFTRDRVTGRVMARRRIKGLPAFRRLGPNLLRLCRTEVRSRGQRPHVLAEPYPYWQVYSNFKAQRILPQYVGDVPVESKALNPDLRYGFEFDVRGYRGTPVLVLDPRCARGTFRIWCNGRAVGGMRRFPLDNIRALRVPLAWLRHGRNVIELRFEVESAMEGLLSQLYVEGDFTVRLGRVRPVLEPRQDCDSRAGWQAGGMPHYMGAGVYAWTETISGVEAKSDWALELEHLVDNAELTVDGRSCGVRAWMPWRWTLPALREGEHRFRLHVYGSAANKHMLGSGPVAQGWIGKAWLCRMG